MKPVEQPAWKCERGRESTKDFGEINEKSSWKVAPHRLILLINHSCKKHEAACPCSLSSIVAGITQTWSSAKREWVEHANKSKSQSKTNKLCADIMIFEVAGLQNNWQTTAVVLLWDHAVITFWKGKKGTQMACPFPLSLKGRSQGNDIVWNNLRSLYWLPRS